MSVLDTDLPPFAVFCAVIDPAGAEQISGDEILAILGISRNPLVALFVVVHIVAVCQILPAVFLAVIKYGAFTGASAFPCAKCGFAEIIDLDKGNNIFCYLGFTILGRTCKFSVGSKLVSTYLCDCKLMFDRPTSFRDNRNRYNIPINRNIVLRRRMPR